MANQGVRWQCDGMSQVDQAGHSHDVIVNEPDDAGRNRAATGPCREPGDAVRDGQFRRHGVPLRVMPLRQRRYRVEVLVEIPEAQIHGAAGSSELIMSVVHSN